VREFLFKISWKLLRLFAQDKEQIDSFVSLYHQKVVCKRRQDVLNFNVRPRTETYEWLSCGKQRDIYLKGKRIRGSSFSDKMRHTDHIEAVKYHGSG